jgi:hypothetical protein
MWERTLLENQLPRMFPMLSRSLINLRTYLLQDPKGSEAALSIRLLPPVCLIGGSMECTSNYTAR